MKKLLLTFYLLVSVAISLAQESDATKTDVPALLKAMEERIEQLENESDKKGIRKLRKEVKEIKKHLNQPNATAPKIVRFNFSDKTSNVELPSDLKHGDFYRVIVDSINLNRYRVVMETKDTTFSSPLSFPTFGTLDLSSLSGLVSDLVVSVGAAGKTADEVDSLITLDVLSNKFNLSDYEGLISDYEVEMGKYDREEETADLVRAKTSQAKVKAEKYLLQLNEVNEEIEDKKVQYMAHRVIRQTPEKMDEYKPDVPKDLKKFIELRAQLKALKKQIDADVKDISKFMEKEKIATFLNLAKNKVLKENLQKSQKALVDAVSKTTKALGIIGSTQIEKQMVSVLNLYEHNKYESLPIQFYGEQTELKMSFIPKDSASGLQPYTLSPIRFPERKTYWSVGSAIYLSRLENDRIGFRKTILPDSTSRYTLLDQGERKGEIGTALLLRAGYKFARQFGGHVAVGTGLSLSEKVRPRMLVGAGISLGTKHSITLDMGMIAGNVDRVKGASFEEEHYFEKPEVLVNSLEFNVFGSVGYSFLF